MPNIDENLAFAPSHELAALIADKQVSPVEITRLYYDRIERLDSQLNSYLTLTQNMAMDSAREAEAAVMRGDELGPAARCSDIHQGLADDGGCADDAGFACVQGPGAYGRLGGGGAREGDRRGDTGQDEYA